MKYILFIFSLLLVLNCSAELNNIDTSLSAPSYQDDNKAVYKTLPNGMQIVAKKNTGNTSVGYYAFVKTGSVNEGVYIGAGISHILEHVVSGGTTKYRTEDEYSQMGKEIGAIVNAYTTQEVTAYHLIADKQYKDIALEMLSEQITSCAFDSLEFAREQKVILKEIIMRSTPPHSKIWQRANEIVYPNSNKQHPVIGYTELFKKITREEIENYYYQRYAPNNMIFVAVGDFNEIDMLSKLENTFIDFERVTIEPEYLPVQNQRFGELKFIEEFDIQQPQVRLSTILPSADYGDDLAVSTAFSILFDKRQSPIKYKLIEELQLVNYIWAYVEANPTSPEGLINIIFEAKDASDVQKIIDIIDTEIYNYATNVKSFTYNDIQNIINRTRAQKIMSMPSVDDECNEIGWNMIHNGIPDLTFQYLQELTKLTPEKMQNALVDHLSPKNRVVFIATPIGQSEVSSSDKESNIKKEDAIKHILGDLTLIHRQNSEKPIVSGLIYMHLSSEFETKENKGMISFMTSMLFNGSKNYNALDISEWKEDHVVSLNSWTDRDGTFIKFKCLKDDFNDLQNIIFDAFNNAQFPESEIELFKERKTGSYKRSLSRADSRHSEFRSSVLYGDTRDGLTDKNKLDILLKTERADLANLKLEYFKTNKAVITLFGDLNTEEAVSVSENIFNQIPKGSINKDKTALQVNSNNNEFVNPYNFEQVNLDLNCKAPSLSQPDYNVMKVIDSILRGSRGRLFKATRGVTDLAYFAYSTYIFTSDYGIFRLSSQTSIDKKYELIQVLKEQLNLLKTELVSEEEISIAIIEQQKIMKSYMDDNKLPYWMTHYEANGLGFDYLDKIVEDLQNVTPQDIMRVSNAYFNEITVLVSEPDENVKLMVD
jgi:zinc protease